MNQQPRVIDQWNRSSTTYRLVYTGVTYELQVLDGKRWYVVSDFQALAAHLVDIKETREC